MDKFPPFEPEKRLSFIRIFMYGILLRSGVESLEFIVDNINYLFDKYADFSLMAPVTEGELLEILDSPRPATAANQEDDSQEFHFLHDGKVYCSSTFSHNTDTEEAKTYAGDLLELRIPAEREFYSSGALLNTSDTIGEKSAHAQKFLRYLKNSYKMPSEDARETLKTTLSKLISSANNDDILAWLLDISGLTPACTREYDEFARFLWLVFNTSPRWVFHGYTQQQLVDKGVESPLILSRQQLADEITAFMEDYFKKNPDKRRPAPDDEEDEYGEQDDALDEDQLPEELAEAMSESLRRRITSLLPDANRLHAKFDFSIVKNPAWRREALNSEYLLKAFMGKSVPLLVKTEMRESDLPRATKNLEFAPNFPKFLRTEFATLYALLIDDSAGDPPVNHIIDKYSGSDAAGILPGLVCRFLEHYRYSCFEIQAVRTGLGFKCRDMFSGKELFVVDEKVSNETGIKGCALFTGLIPCNEAFVQLGPSNLFIPTTAAEAFADALDMLGITGTPPKDLTYSQLARLARYALKLAQRKLDESA